MASRISEEEVKALLAPYAESSDVTLFMEQALVLVDEELVGKGLSDSRLRIIELNLAAHFAVLSVERGGFAYQKSGLSEESYAVNREVVQFSSTRFGQQALAMDSTGSLNRLDSPKGRAELFMQ